MSNDNISSLFPDEQSIEIQWMPKKNSLLKQEKKEPAPQNYTIIIVIILVIMGIFTAECLL